jgi:lysozyme family protein
MPFDQILNTTLKLEGGLNTKETNGGVSNYGITQQTYDAVAPQLGLSKKNVRDLGYKEVRSVYESEFYKKPKYDQIPYEKIQGLVFDWGVNAGTGLATRKLQEIVGTKADGKIGKNTLEALNKYVDKYGEDTLAIEILQKRLEHYNSLIASDPQKYGYWQEGWDNRLKYLADRYK